MFIPKVMILAPSTLPPLLVAIQWLQHNKHGLMMNIVDHIQLGVCVCTCSLVCLWEYVVYGCLVSFITWIYTMLLHFTTRGKNKKNKKTKLVLKHETLSWEQIHVKQINITCTIQWKSKGHSIS